VVGGVGCIVKPSARNRYRMMLELKNEGLNCKMRPELENPDANPKTGRDGKSNVNSKAKTREGSRTLAGQGDRGSSIGIGVWR
jgi:hypothetical protein